MFAFRTTWLVKHGKMEEALALILSEIEKSGDVSAEWRVYTPHYSPDQLVFENTWETVEDNVAFWGAYHASEAGRAFYQAWDQLVERRVSNYVWKVEVSP